jgi:ribosomal protein S2
MQGKILDVNIAKQIFENMMKVRYLGMTLTNQNYIHEEIFGLKRG